MGSVSYEIVVRCICGEVKVYKLNMYKNKLIIVGREHKTSFYPHIGLHGDDKHFLSRATLYFAYDFDKKDWIVGKGFPDKKYWENIPQINEIEKDIINTSIPGKYISYTGNNFKDQIIHTMIKNKKYECEQLYKDQFYDLADIQMLSDIGGIGIHSTIANNEDAFKLFYKKQEVLGLKHPVLPDLPFGWYIEIKSNVTVSKAVLSRLETNLK